MRISTVIAAAAKRRGWSATAYGIRTAEGLSWNSGSQCPVTAACSVLTGVHYWSVLFRSAAAHMGLSGRKARAIAIAADARPHRRRHRVIRMALEKALL